MADKYTTTTHTIFNHDVFCELSKDFDQRFQTRTYIGFDSLANIKEKFPMLSDKPKRPNELFVHGRIMHNIKLLFLDKQKKVVKSEDFMVKDTRESPRPFELHFFNSVYRFLIDIRAGKGLYGPLSVSRFINGHRQIHPGSHRLIMSEVYKEPMMFVLTDYNTQRDLVKTKKVGELYHPEHTWYDWRRGRWCLREMNYNQVYWQSTQREKKYKDIIDQLTDDDEHSFHKPELADRKYVLKEDHVIVNGIPVCEKIDGYWKIVQP